MKEEERELGQLENVDSEEGEKINLDEIGLEKQNVFGGSNLNAALALQFQQQTNKRAMMVRSGVMCRRRNSLKWKIKRSHSAV